MPGVGATRLDGEALSMENTCACGVTAPLYDVPGIGPRCAVCAMTAEYAEIEEPDPIEPPSHVLCRLDRPMPPAARKAVIRVNTHDMQRMRVRLGLPARVVPDERPLRAPADVEAT